MKDLIKVLGAGLLAAVLFFGALVVLAHLTGNAPNWGSDEATSGSSAGVGAATSGTGASAAEGTSQTGAVGASLQDNSTEAGSGTSMSTEGVPGVSMPGGSTGIIQPGDGTGAAGGQQSSAGSTIAGGGAANGASVGSGTGNGDQEETDFTPGEWSNGPAEDSLTNSPSGGDEDAVPYPELTSPPDNQTLPSKIKENAQAAITSF